MYVPQIFIICTCVNIKTVRNRLIGYLTFISVNWNLETTNQLTGYSVKVHSTNTHTVILRKTADCLMLFWIHTYARMYTHIQIDVSLTCHCTCYAVIFLENKLSEGKMKSRFSKIQRASTSTDYWVRIIICLLTQWKIIIKD